MLRNYQNIKQKVKTTNSKFTEIFVVYVNSRLDVKTT